MADQIQIVEFKDEILAQPVKAAKALTGQPAFKLFDRQIGGQFRMRDFDALDLAAF